jgi:hypothetical protein
VPPLERSLSMFMGDPSHSSAPSSSTGRILSERGGGVFRGDEQDGTSVAEGVGTNEGSDMACCIEEDGGGGCAFQSRQKLLENKMLTVQQADAQNGSIMSVVPTQRPGPGVVAQRESIRRSYHSLVLDVGGDKRSLSKIEE